MVELLQRGVIMEEIFDVYTREGIYLGTKPKSFCHSENPEVYHKPVWIWAINSQGEILVQKRSQYKKSNPNKWDMSVAGHSKSGESHIDAAIRETFEEIGIQTKKDDYDFLFEYCFEQGWELAQVYLLKIDIPVNKMHLSSREIGEVKWLPFTEFKKLLYSKDFAPHNMDFRRKICHIIKKCIKK